MPVLDRIGEWLGTTPGFVFNIAVALACIPVALLISPDVSTWVLSLIAIVLPAFILHRDHSRDCVADRRDDAMHKKLDELLHGVDKADDRLAGIEQD